MLVFAPHRAALSRALSSPSPVLSLPPLHPEYLRALLTRWGQESGATIKLLEPGVGRSVLKSDSEALPSGHLGHLRRFSTTTEPICDQIEAAIHRAQPGAGTVQVLWLTGVAEFLTEPAAASHLAALCRRIVAHRLPFRLVLDAAPASLPDALEPWLREVELNAPREQDFAVFVDKVIAAQLSHHHPEQSASISVLLRQRPDGGGDRPLETIHRSLQGLDAGAINLVIEAGLSGLGRSEDFVPELLKRIEQERRRQLDRASGLKVIDNTFKSGELQGMNRYKRYLDYVRVLFRDPSVAARGGKRARGVLLVGLPGCGKSMAARMTAHKIGVPLLKLDVGEMMGSLLGESEANLSRALDTAEAAAPCVLWVDEIEKALGGMSGGKEGGGTGSRMLGKLLGWMQDHTAQVYLFATANKVKVLPPELLRRGRFDELWRVMLPSADERRAIFAQKLRELPEGTLSDPLQDAVRMDRPVDDAAFKKLWKKQTDGYTGADIASVVFEVWMGHVVHEKPIAVSDLAAVIEGGFQPMSVQFQDDIKEMTRDLERHGFRDVTETDEKRLPPPVRPERMEQTEMLPTLLRPLWTEEVPMVLRLRSGRRIQIDAPGAERSFATATGTKDVPIAEQADARQGRIVRQGAQLLLTIRDKLWATIMVSDDRVIVRSAGESGDDALDTSEALRPPKPVHSALVTRLNELSRKALIEVLNNPRLNAQPNVTTRTTKSGLILQICSAAEAVATNRGIVREHRATFVERLVLLAATPKDLPEIAGLKDSAKLLALNSTLRNDYSPKKLRIIAKEWGDPLPHPMSKNALVRMIFSAAELDYLMSIRSWSTTSREVFINARIRGYAGKPDQSPKSRFKRGAQRIPQWATNSCLHCGKTFDRHATTAPYCSYVCKGKAL